MKTTIKIIVGGSLAVVIGLTLAVKIQEATGEFGPAPQGQHFEVVCFDNDRVFGLDALTELNVSGSGLIRYRDAQGRLGLVHPLRFDTCIIEERSNTDDDGPSAL